MIVGHYVKQINNNDRTMSDLNISSCVAEIFDCMMVHRAFFKEELRRGTTPDRYGTLTSLDQAVEKALQIIIKVPEFMRINKKYADEHVYPLIRDTYAIKEEFCKADAEVALPKLLIMSGFVAIALNHTDTAENIFQALKIFRPQSEYPLIGIAYVLLSKGRYEQAIETLRDKALEINPQSDLAKAFLALSYSLTKKLEEMKHLTNQIIDSDKDRNAMDIASALLSEYHLLRG